MKIAGKKPWYLEYHSYYSRNRPYGEPRSLPVLMQQEW